MTEEAKNLGQKKVKSSFLEGINLREYFAGLAMQGYCANTNTVFANVRFTDVSGMAVRQADALLEELSKTE